LFHFFVAFFCLLANGRRSVTGVTRLFKPKPATEYPEKIRTCRAVRLPVRSRDCVDKRDTQENV
jgi:hypothetical protein